MRKSIDTVNHLTAPSPAAADVFEAIHSVMHLYRAAQYRGLRGGAEGLTHLEGKVLGFFARHPGATQKDLVEHSGRDKGQLARLIGGLRERGLLDAAPDEVDRRNIRLQPSAQGRAVFQTLNRQARRLAEQAIAVLDEPERRQLAWLLEKLHAGLKAGAD